jgi:hypothetical protein
MTLGAGPFAIGAVLLILGGAAKVRAPHDTATAMRGVGVPATSGLIRIAALAEIAFGAYALAVGDNVAAGLVAVSYVVFAAFVAVALMKDAPIATCGCFGKADTPPSLVHVGCNLLLAAGALAVAIDPSAGIADVIRQQPMAGVPFVMLVTVGVGLTYLALTSLPRLLSRMRVVER